jgi:predicted porin
MKKSMPLLAVAAALSTAGYAHAQSNAGPNVQVYGLIDAGVEYIDHADAKGGSMARVVSGGKNTSRWGLRGTEDLGGGMKAVFGLEGGILLDTGAADGALFKRQAYVGLEGAAGRIVLGRSFTTVYDFVIKFDPLGFAPNYSWATSGAATGPSKYGMTTAFDNLVKYSGSTGNLSYGASIGLGEQPGGAAEGRKYATAVSWTQSGLGVMASYESINGTTVVTTGNRDQTSAFHVAADYKTDAWRYSAGMRGYKLESGKAATPDVRADTYWLGISRYIDKVTLTGAVYHVNVKNVAAGKDADPTMFVARGMYALSKRTDLYLSAAHVKGKNGQLVGLSRDDAAFGTTQTGVTGGIQHRF